MTGLEAGRWYEAYLGQLRATNAAVWHTLQVQRQGRGREREVTESRLATRSRYHRGTRLLETGQVTQGAAT